MIHNAIYVFPAWSIKAIALEHPKFKKAKFLFEIKPFIKDYELDFI